MPEDRPLSLRVVQMLEKKWDEMNVHNKSGKSPHCALVFSLVYYIVPHRGKTNALRFVTQEETKQKMSKLFIKG